MEADAEEILFSAIRPSEAFEADPRDLTELEAGHREEAKQAAKPESKGPGPELSRRAWRPLGWEVRAMKSAQAADRRAPNTWDSLWWERSSNLKSECELEKF